VTYLATSTRNLVAFCCIAFQLLQSRLHLCAHSLITTVEEALKCNWGDQSIVKMGPSSFHSDSHEATSRRVTMYCLDIVADCLKIYLELMNLTCLFHLHLWLQIHHILFMSVLHAANHCIILVTANSQSFSTIITQVAI